jgi:hypothetical protein
MAKQTPIHRIIGVNIVNSGNLASSCNEDRFKLMQLIKTSFNMEFNAARIIVNDMYAKKFKEPYGITGFEFSHSVFSDLAHKYNIEYGYIYGQEPITNKDNKIQDCRGLSKFNLEQLSEYISDLENQNYSMQMLLKERNMEIAMMQQSILNIHRSIKRILPEISSSKLTFDTLVKGFNTEDE